MRRHDRYRTYQPTIAGWDTLLVLNRSEQPDLKVVWDEVLSNASSAATQGAHICAFHNSISEYEKFERQIEGRHRLIWLDRKTLSFYGTPSFTKLLESIADFESEWRDKIRPRGLDSPLILPNTSFRARSGFQDCWTRAQRIRSGRGNLDELAELLRRFRPAHRFGDCWRDGDNIEFRHDHGHHGSHPPLRNRWKFTMAVPVGFHYDVRHRTRKRAFSIRDDRGSV